MSLLLDFAEFGVVLDILGTPNRVEPETIEFPILVRLEHEGAVSAPELMKNVLKCQIHPFVAHSRPGLAPHQSAQTASTKPYLDCGNGALVSGTVHEEEPETEREPAIVPFVWNSRFAVGLKKLNSPIAKSDLTPRKVGCHHGGRASEERDEAL